uniref:BHLH domain-containing protein n=1 Tax=Timema cristinae TaxID=61476 RepID=A0A7R9CDB4_TIMCR|nr:unnamed protein product [Timema cristinae]
MAAATLSNMTLGPQQKPMAGFVQTSASSNNTSCVIVTTASQQTNLSSHSPHLHHHHQGTAPKTILIQQKRVAVAAPGDRTTVVINNISSAPNTSSASSMATADMLRCKRRINFSYSGIAGHQPASVARRNARERNRVKQVNNGFATLRSHIPVAVAAALSSPIPNPSNSSNRGASKKLSKVETLRMAVEYIRSLQQMLDDHAAETSSTTSSTLETTTMTTVGPASSSDQGYYSSSPESSVTQLTTVIPTSHYSSLSHSILLQPQIPLVSSSLSPPCSEASSSPTPSLASDGSGGSALSYAAPSSVYHQQNYEPENYEPMSPEDEVLLDAIFGWQQSQ